MDNLKSQDQPQEAQEAQPASQEDLRQAQVRDLQEALDLGNRVRHLLKDRAFLGTLQARVAQLGDRILQLSPAQVDEFRDLSMARQALLEYFNSVKGMVAAGEAAAQKLEGLKQDSKPQAGGLL